MKFKGLEKLKQSWEDFLKEQHERWAQESLDALVNDENFIEKNLAGEELPWQPYPVLETEDAGTPADDNEG